MASLSCGHRNAAACRLVRGDPLELWATVSCRFARRAVRRGGRPDTQRRRAREARVARLAQRPLARAAPRRTRWQASRLRGSFVSPCNCLTRLFSSEGRTDVAHHSEPKTDPPEEKAANAPARIGFCTRAADITTNQ